MFDAQVLLEPLEEQLDLPALLLNSCDSRSRQIKAIGQKCQVQTRLTIKEANSAQRLWVARLGVVANQSNRLIPDHARLGIHVMRL